LKKKLFWKPRFFRSHFPAMCWPSVHFLASAQRSWLYNASTRYKDHTIDTIATFCARVLWGIV